MTSPQEAHLFNDLNIPVFNKSPLPFAGQKRNFIKEFRQLISKIPDDYLVVDVFGGCGLLSHNAKSVNPKLEVIYNDFDNFTQRLQNIEKSNQLMAKIKEVLKTYPKKQKLTEDLKYQVQNIIKQSDFIDVQTLASKLLFSGNQVSDLEGFFKQPFYNCLSLSDFKSVDYLKNVQTISEDFLTIKQKYKTHKKILYILDPPYFASNMAAYGKGHFWTLAKYLETIELVINNKFIFFSSDKSSVLELIDFFNKYLSETSKITYYKIQKNICLNKTARYNDNLISNI